MAKSFRKGDKGEEVKQIQKALGINADGIFGSNTESSVKSFQKSKGLTVDGIVGKATLSAMGISFEDKKTEDIIITKTPITRHITKKCRTIKYIVLHYTASSSSCKGSAMKSRNNFQNSDRDASADFIVDDETIVQANPDPLKNYCWAVGDGNGKYGITNSNSVSIEMCSTLEKGCSSSAANHNGWTLSDKVLDNALKLTRYLMKTYNIPKDKVVRHYDASRKMCPGVVGWNDAALYDEKTGKKTSTNNNSKKWLEWKNKL